MEQQTISWSAPEYVYVQKSVDWFWALGIIAISGAVLSFFLNNILFSFLLIIGAFSLGLYGARKPEMQDIEISKRGIRINGKLFSYSELHSFWVDQERHEPIILLRVNKFFSPYLSIPLGDMDPEVVEDALAQFIRQREQSEPVFFRAMEYLGF